MTKEALSEAIALFCKVQIASGSVTLSPGEQWNELLVIRKGIFRLYYLDSEGKESNKGFFKEGEILAPIARSAIQGPSYFFIESLTNIEAYRCCYNQLVETLSKYPNGNIFFHRLTEELLEQKIQREQIFLQMDARGRYKKFVADFPELHDRIPLHHLASYLGITNVTLSRIRNKK